MWAFIIHKKKRCYPLVGLLVLGFLKLFVSCLSCLVLGASIQANLPNVDVQFISLHIIICK
jgi:hypothetical protein